MNKRTLVIILTVLAFFSISYSIYKGTAPTITTVEPGRTIVYGQPQHGLTMGLGVFAGFCVLSASLLLLDDKRKIADETSSAATATTTSNRIATNYPR